jgi:hypothetical protein
MCEGEKKWVGASGGPGVDTDACAVPVLDCWSGPTGKTGGGTRTKGQNGAEQEQEQQEQAGQGQEQGEQIAGSSVTTERCSARGLECPRVLKKKMGAGGPRG